MSVSEVEICNMALAKLGVTTRINSLEEDGHAVYCKLFWPHVRDAVLRSHPWNCARGRRSLTPLSATPDFEYDYQYQLPVNPYCLRAYTLYDTDTKWRVEGRLLLCDDDTVDLMYIKRVTDPSEYDPMLVDVLVLKMALKIAGPVTGGNKMNEGLIKELEGISLPEARSIDAHESSLQELETTTWSDARL